jgi:hypothetical protein
MNGWMLFCFLHIQLALSRVGFWLHSFAWICGRVEKSIMIFYYWIMLSSKYGIIITEALLYLLIVPEER